MEYAEAKAYLIRRLAQSSATSERLRRALVRRGASEELIAQLLEESRSAGYICDDEFAKSFIAKEMRRCSGPRLIVAKLIAQGISSEAAYQLVEEEYPDEAQREAIEKLQEIPRYSALPRQKFAALLWRRGF